MNNWHAIKLGDILKVRSGHDQKTIECKNGKYQILGTSGEIGRTNTFLYDKPSVLIGRKGTINKPMYKDEPFWTVDTLFYTEIKDDFLPKYVYHLFNTINWLRYNEASGVPSLTSSTIERIKVKVPDLETQQKIVQILDDTDKYLTLLKQKVLLEERKEAKLSKILLSKNDYKTTTLEDICDYEQPQKYLVSDVNYQKSGTPVLTANKAFILGYTNETNGIYEAHNNPIVLLDDFTCDCKYVDFDFKIKSSAIKILKPKKETPTIILYWILKNISIDISGEHKRHYLSELINKKVPIMDNMTSKNITNILKAEKNIIDNTRTEIYKMEMIYKYLLNHLISGDFDLTNIKLENGKEQQ